jgi:hypothetical protein
MRCVLAASTAASGVTDERAPATFWKRAGAAWRRLDQRVPRAAMRALALPLGRRAAALGAAVDGLRLATVAAPPCALSRARRCDHGRAELAHDHAGRFVGDAHRVGQRRAGREQRAERGDHRVARAGHVVHLARLRGIVSAPSSVKSVMPSSERVTSSASRSSGAQLLRLRGHLRLVAPAADDLAELGAVGREQRARRGTVATRRPWDRPARACAGARARSIIVAMCARPPLP